MESSRKPTRTRRRPRSKLPKLRRGWLSLLLLRIRTTREAWLLIRTTTKEERLRLQLSPFTSRCFLERRLSSRRRSRLSLSCLRERLGARETVEPSSLETWASRLRRARFVPNSQPPSSFRSSARAHLSRFVFVLPPALPSPPPRPPPRLHPSRQNRIHPFPIRRFLQTH